MYLLRCYIKFICALQYKLYKYRKEVKKTEINTKLVVIYRISDAGYKKEKPQYINNELCLKNAESVFPCSRYEWIVIADNCSLESIEMIARYIPSNNICQVSIGHGAGTFNLALNKALSFDDETIIYFLENDYLHLPSSDGILHEGFELGVAEYVTLYDHPNKYNFAFIWDGEKSKVYLSRSIHWKITNSTTMTFAAKVKTLKKDEKILRCWTNGIHPYDFEMFTHLRKIGRSLICPIPGFSTHGETKLLTPLVDWSKI